MGRTCAATAANVATGSNESREASSDARPHGMTRRRGRSLTTACSLILRPGRDP